MAGYMVIVPCKVVECGEPDSERADEIRIVANSWIGAVNKFTKSLQDLADRAELAAACKVPPFPSAKPLTVDEAERAARLVGRTDIALVVRYMRELAAGV